MEGSRLPKPVERSTLHAAAIFGVAAVIAVPAGAADVDSASGTVGPPTVLFSPASPPATPQPVRSAAATAPPAVKRPTASAVHTIPVEAKPLIPPAPLPAKLGPPPEPRPALSLETDLQPLGPAPQTPDGAASPAAAKPPSS